MSRQVARRTLIDGAAGANVRSNTGQAAALKAIRDFQQWATMLPQYKQVSARMDVLKKSIKDHVDTVGDLDDKGHKNIPFDEPMEIEGVMYLGLRNEARKTTTLDEEFTEALLKSKGLYDQATITTVSIDQDKIFDLYQRELISDEDLNKIFNTKTIWAFKPYTV